MRLTLSTVPHQYDQPIKNLSKRQSHTCHLIPGASTLSWDMGHEQAYATRDVSNPSNQVAARGGIFISESSECTKFQKRGILVQQQRDSISCYLDINRFSRGQLANLRSSCPRPWCLFRETSFPSAETCLSASSNLSSTGVQLSLLAWNCGPRRSMLVFATGNEDSVAMVNCNIEIHRQYFQSK